MTILRLPYNRIQWPFYIYYTAYSIASLYNTNKKYKKKKTNTPYLAVFIEPVPVPIPGISYRTEPDANIFLTKFTAPLSAINRSNRAKYYIIIKKYMEQEQGKGKKKQCQRDNCLLILQVFNRLLYYYINRELE